MEDNFQIGDKVIEIDSGRKGRIVEIVSQSRRGVLYSVLFVGASQEEQVRDIYLEPDFDISNPFSRCKQHIFKGYYDFARINTSFKIDNTSNSTISSLKASKTIFKPYQFKPLLKFLNSDNKRLLVADEVGLGKTIEAGHIMLELKARKELRNVLIICPKALQIKWQEELSEKFSLSFTIYDRTLDIIRDLKTKDGAFRGILTYDRIRLDKKDEKMEDDSKLLGFINQYEKRFSLILCDEAHRLRNQTTQGYRGAEFLMSRAKAAVFLTATPIMLGNENLYNLLHLLDDQSYDNKADFQNSLNLNVPFMEALRQLRTNKSLPMIAEDLCNSEVTTYYSQYNDISYCINHTIQSYYAEDPLFQRIIKWMKEEKDTKDLRAKLQFDLTSMSGMNSIFSRTRKREVTKDWSQAERHPFPYQIELTKEERKVYDHVINTYIEDNSYVDAWGDVKLTHGAAMGLVTKKRQVASSVYAYLNDEDDLDKGIDEYAGHEDAKVNTLISIMKELTKRGEEKLIVFCLFKKTIKYLNIRLKKAGYNCAIIHGDVKDRNKEINKFRQDPDCQILLSSEVGSEGLDMQFCSSMVNYDLPWNPMVVEQRIGRIDRFGQQSSVVKIYNLIVKDSIQEDIYSRLLERIGIFRSSIGDLEAILQSDFKKGVTIQSVYNKLEEDLFCNKRTREEYLRKVDEIAQAVANEAEELKRIEENETNTLTIDSYFQHEIDRILHNNAYLSERELINYINMMLEDALPSCRLVDKGDDMYQIVIPKSSPKMIFRFMDQYHPIGDEMNIQLKTFKNKVDGKTAYDVTFSQEKAFNDKNLNYINMYHPLILSALGYFKNKEESNNSTFNFVLNKDNVAGNLNPGQYFLGIYRIVESHTVYGVEKETTTLLPIVYSVNDEKIIDDESITNSFFGKAQVCGQYKSVADVDIPNNDIIDDMSLDMSDYASQCVKSKKQELWIRMESRREQRLQQLEERLQLSIKRFRRTVSQEEAEYELALSMNDESEIDRLARTIRLHKGNLNRMENDYEEQKLKLSKTPELSVHYEIVSLSLIELV